MMISEAHYEELKAPPVNPYNEEAGQSARKEYRQHTEEAENKDIRDDTRSPEGEGKQRHHQIPTKRMPGTDDEDEHW